MRKPTFSGRPAAVNDDDDETSTCLKMRNTYQLLLQYFFFYYCSKLVNIYLNYVIYVYFKVITQIYACKVMGFPHSSFNKLPKSLEYPRNLLTQNVLVASPFKRLTLTRKM